MKKKRLVGTLRQILGTSSLATSSTICHLAKKKKLATQPIKEAPASPLASSSTSASSTSSSADNTELDSMADSSTAATEPETEVEPMVPRIICEPKGEEDMAKNLKFGFKERQRKWLFESITVAPPPARNPTQSCVLVARLSTGKNARHERVGPSTGSALVSNDSIECVAYVPPRPQASRASSWEEMAKLLKRVSVDLDGDPRIFFAAHLLFGTLEPVFSCIWTMQDFTTVEMAEVVVVDVCNLDRQCTILFKRLEVAEAMKAFITQRMDRSEELHSKLKLAESELAIARKVVDERVESLRKVEEEKETVNAEAR
ncbi:hypothetical protein CK203_068990 [Vitis vinifera]|uniref:Uncharacterized protein n=1 Tax=Vitis vinifera TaxID=29760 RepID=A0A438F0Y1_VITVI|nr:hypothetical protein CK203_068990 [Vitis vinifera]